MQKEVLMLRDSLFMAILALSHALCTGLAQPSLLGICLAAAWQAKPLVTSVAKRGLRVLVDPGSPGIHLGVSATKSTRQTMPCRW
jgi:hypothetical protein